MTSDLLDRAATALFNCPSFCTNHYDEGLGSSFHQSDRFVGVHDSLDIFSGSLVVDICQNDWPGGTTGPGITVMWAMHEHTVFTPDVARRLGEAALTALTAGTTAEPFTAAAYYDPTDQIQVRWSPGWPEEHAGPYVEVAYLAGAQSRTEPVVVLLDEYDAREFGEGLLRAADMAVAP